MEINRINNQTSFGAVRIDKVDRETIDALKELKAPIGNLKALLNMNSGDALYIRSASNPNAVFTNLGLFGVEMPKEELVNKNGVLFVFPEETERVMNHLTDSLAMEKELDNIIKTAKRISSDSIKAKILELKAQAEQILQYSQRNKNTRLKEIPKLEQMQENALRDLGLEYTD